MNIFILLRILASVWAILGVALFVPGVFALFIASYSASHFLLLGTGLILVSVLVLRFTWQTGGDVNQRMALLVVFLSWISACVIGALPYWVHGFSSPLVHISFIDAVFESTSGFTGTGASILTDIESLPSTLLLWRSMTQWLGGLGIVLFFLAILPLVGVAGGGSLFKAEATGPQKDKITPRVKETAQRLWKFYLFLSVTLVFLLWIVGMPLFDAINHSMTTISTGGFSIKNTGIAAYESSAIEWVLALFMLLSSISFMVLFRVFLHFDRRALFNTELKGYLSIVFIASLIFTFVLWNPIDYPYFLDALRVGVFSVICTVTTSGFTNHDYTEWSHFLQYILILLMVMGGMSGSTSGGVKCIRVIAAFKQLSRELVKVLHPTAIVPVRINSVTVSEGVANTIWGLLFLYFLVFSLMTGFFTLDGLDIYSARTAAITALSNIGPAMGQFGPFDNFSSLSIFSKLVMIIGMLVGRLEFYTVVVLFTPYFWRR